MSPTHFSIFCLAGIATLAQDAIATEPPGQKLALLVAVRQYNKNELHSLKFTENDVDDLAKFLKEAGYRRVVLMTQTVGADETRYLPLAANIRKELKGLLEDRQENDSVLVAFSGHGIQFKGDPDSYFCPADARLSDRTSLISTSDVYKLLDASGAGVKLLFIDACRNDPRAEISKARAEVDLESVTRPQRKLPPGGLAVFFSCSEGERSFESPRLKRGVFFHFVLKGLQGGADFDKDGRVSLDELSGFVKREVPLHVRDEIEAEIRQMPEMIGKTRGIVPLVELATTTAVRPPMPKPSDPMPPKKLSSPPQSQATRNPEPPAAGGDSTDWPQWRGPNRDNRSAFVGLKTDWDTPPKLEWEIDGLGKGNSTVICVGNRIFTTGQFQDYKDAVGSSLTGQALIAIDRAEHRVVWRRLLTEELASDIIRGAAGTPTYSDGTLFAITTKGDLVAASAADGRIRWKRDLRQDWSGVSKDFGIFAESPLVDGTTVVCTPGSENALMVGLHAETGKERWRTKMLESTAKRGNAGAGTSSIVISHGAGVKQYVKSTSCGVVGVRASDGKHLWTYDKLDVKTMVASTCLIDGDYVFASTGYGAGSVLLKLSALEDGVSAEEIYRIAGKDLQNHHGGMVLVDGHVYMGHGHSQGIPACIEFATGKQSWPKMRAPGVGSAAVIAVDGHILFQFSGGQLILFRADPGAHEVRGVFRQSIPEETFAHPVISGRHFFLRSGPVLQCYDIGKS